MSFAGVEYSLPDFLCGGSQGENQHVANWIIFLYGHITTRKIGAMAKEESYSHWRHNDIVGEMRFGAIMRGERLFDCRKHNMLSS